ncbi:hypothetical protein KC343_g14988 [Hortaea werneckii]|nr:hypothetical protein KC343_g14988 [Hortaea werneckii]
MNVRMSTKESGEKVLQASGIGVCVVQKIGWDIEERGPRISFGRPNLIGSRNVSFEAEAVDFACEHVDVTLRDAWSKKNPHSKPERTANVLDVDLNADLAEMHQERETLPPPTANIVSSWLFLQCVSDCRAPKSPGYDRLLHLPVENERQRGTWP